MPVYGQVRSKCVLWCTAKREVSLGETLSRQDEPARRDVVKWWPVGVQWCTRVSVLMTGRMDARMRDEETVPTSDEDGKMVQKA